MTERQVRVAGVIGWPIHHSRSPQLHGHWLKRYGIAGAYLPFAVPPDRLETALAGLAGLGLRGINVTVPHKEACLDLVDSADAHAQRIGAINTLFVTPEGGLAGTNTDHYGFTENLRAATDLSALSGGTAVVLGAGGAARAVVAALVDIGLAHIVLCNRSIDRAEALAAALPASDGERVSVRPWQRRADLTDVHVLVNTTTLGMVGQPPLEIALDGLPDTALVCDLVYVPLQTPLLKAAAARGLRTVDGLGMLLHQARPGFAAWFGVDPMVDSALRMAVLAEG